MNDPLYEFLTDDKAEYRYECGFYAEIVLYVRGIPGAWAFDSCYCDDERAAYMVIYRDLRSKRILTVTAVGGKYPPTLAYSIS